MTGGDVTGDMVVRREPGLRERLPSTAWPVLRAVLLLAWVSWAVLSWWAAPRTDDLAGITDDLAAGRVVSVQWGDRWEGDADDWDYRPMLASSGDGGPIVAWRTTDWRLHHTDTRIGTDTGGSVDQRVAAIRQATTAAGLTPGSITDDRPVRIGTAISLTVALSVVALLVTGPVPMVGTRWYWWWILVGLPFGLGLVYWLWRERPWSRAAEVPLGPPNSDPRRRWYLGILAGLLASIAVGMATALLRHLLGDGIVPNP